MIYMQQLLDLPEALRVEGDPVQDFTQEFFGIYAEDDGLLAVVGVMPHGMLSSTATLWFAIMPGAEPRRQHLRWAKSLTRVLLQCLPFKEVRAEAIVGDKRGERFLHFLGFRFAGTLDDRHIFVGDKT